MLSLLGASPLGCNSNDIRQVGKKEKAHPEWGVPLYEKRELLPGCYFFSVEEGAFSFIPMVFGGLTLTD